MAASSLDSQIDALYALPLVDFVSARKRLADELRKAGDLAGAGAVKVLRKPTLAAWITNQTVRREPTLLRQLVAATDVMASIQRRSGQGGDSHQRFQDARAEQRRLISQLVDGARRVLPEGEQDDAGQALEKVEKNLSWGPLSPDDRFLFERGRLIADVAPPGFAALTAGETPAEAAGDSPGKRPAPPEQPGMSRSPEPGRDGVKVDGNSGHQARERARAAAEQERVRNQEAAAARARLRHAQADTARARSAVDRSERARDEQRARVEGAMRALDGARAALSIAEDHCLRAHEALAASEQEEAEARRKI